MHTLLLDALGDVGEAGALLLLFKALLLAVLPAALSIYLLLRLWGKRIEKQFQRAPLEVRFSPPPLPPSSSLRGARWYRTSFILSVLLLFLLGPILMMAAH